MASSENDHDVYEKLAERAAGRGETGARDRYLVLAADAAWVAGLADEAERLRQRLLHLNPHHLLRPYHSWEDALQSPDVRTYLLDLQRACPPEKAQDLLNDEPAEEPALPPEPPPPPEPPAFPKVFRPAPPAEEPVPPPGPVRPAPLPPPRPAPPVAKPVSPPRAVPVASPYAAATPPPGPSPAEEEEEAPAADVWVATGLFGLLLVLALALAGYTLLRPFWPG
jgi:hypothetical protein